MNRLEIEWKHYEKDGSTCVRCSETGEALDVVVKQLAEECLPRGWDIVYKETKLTEEDIAMSNVILFNGVPIEDIFPDCKSSESDCESCGELTGDEGTCCRTVEYGGRSYEAIPPALIREAVCRVARCC